MHLGNTLCRAIRLFFKQQQDWAGKTVVTQNIFFMYIINGCICSSRPVSATDNFFFFSWVILVEKPSGKKHSSSLTLQFDYCRPKTVNICEHKNNDEMLILL